MALSVSLKMFKLYNEVYNDSAVGNALAQMDWLNRSHTTASQINGQLLFCCFNLLSYRSPTSLLLPFKAMTMLAMEFEFMITGLLVNSTILYSLSENYHIVS